MIITYTLGKFIIMDIRIPPKKINRTKILIAFGVIIFISYAVYISMSLGGKSILHIDTERIIISTVKTGAFQENIPVNGNVMPITTIYLDALEGGRVEEIFVEDGVVMEKGQPILRLSNSDLELNLLNQETAVYNLLTQMQISENVARENTINKLHRKTEVENAFIEARRMYLLHKSLFEEKAIGSQEFIETKNNYRYQQQRLELALEVLKQDSLARTLGKNQSKSSYMRTQNALALMRKKVGDLIVRAPVNGQLTSLDAQIGQSKNKGERLGQVDVLSGFKVRADIDENYISRIHTGQQATFLLDGKTYSLIIKKVYTQVTNGRFQVDMHFPSEIPGAIRRGQSLRIRLALSNEKKAVLIPRGSFFQKTGGNWIFKLTEDGKSAYRIDIQIGSQNTAYYEVLGGLQPGDKVITSNYNDYGDKYELQLSKK